MRTSNSSLNDLPHFRAEKDAQLINTASRQTQLIQIAQKVDDKCESHLVARISRHRAII